MNDFFNPLLQILLQSKFNIEFILNLSFGTTNSAFYKSRVVSS